MVTIKLPFRDAFVKTLIAKDVTLITKELNGNRTFVFSTGSGVMTTFYIFLLPFKKIK